jgi:two-component system OmpR family response regulator
MPFLQQAKDADRTVAAIPIDNFVSLQLTGFSVDDVRTGREALTLATSNGRLDLIVLDVMLPDLDGFEICRRLRLDRIDSPILFLTALDGLHERIRGLTLGGDDYLIKPFSVEELVARSRALIRRSGRELDQQALTCGPISMDEDAHRVTVRGKAVELSPTEYNLLRYFMSNKGVALTKTQILDLWVPETRPCSSCHHPILVDQPAEAVGAT